MFLECWIERCNIKNKGSHEIRSDFVLANNVYIPEVFVNFHTTERWPK